MVQRQGRWDDTPWLLYVYVKGAGSKLVRCLFWASSSSYPPVLLRGWPTPVTTPLPLVMGRRVPEKVGSDVIFPVLALAPSHLKPSPSQHGQQHILQGFRSNTVLIIMLHPNNSLMLSEFPQNAIVAPNPSMHAESQTLHIPSPLPMPARVGQPPLNTAALPPFIHNRHAPPPIAVAGHARPRAGAGAVVAPGRGMARVA